MNVLLITAHAPDQCRRAIEQLGHAVICIPYRRDRPEALSLETLRWTDRAIIHQGDHKDGTCIPVRVAQQLAQNGIRSTWWTYDPPNKRPLYADLALSCDEQIVCTADDLEWLAAHGGSPRLGFCGIDPAYWRPVHLCHREVRCYGPPVAIVGHLYPDRAEAITLLRANDIDVGTWGTGEHDWPLLDTDRIRYVYQAAAVNVVIPYRWGDVLDPEYLICRHFEIPACAGFMICQSNDAVRNTFPDVPTFNDADEMLDLIRYYLRHPDDRAAIAKATRRRVCDHFTLTRFFGDILEAAPNG